MNRPDPRNSPEPKNSQSRLLSKIIQSLPPGQLTWIGLRSERKGQVNVVPQAMAIEGCGLEGDHKGDRAITQSQDMRSLTTQSGIGGGRQVTLISEEFIQQISHFLGGKPVEPQWLRRNLVVKDINLNALRYRRFKIGEAILEANALCHPCSRMEAALGKGGVAAMMGYGGLCCKVIQGGKMQVGDAVELITPEGQQQASLF